MISVLKSCNNKRHTRKLQMILTQIKVIEKTTCKCGQKFPLNFGERMCTRNENSCRDLMSSKKKHENNRLLSIIMFIKKLTLNNY